MLVVTAGRSPSVLNGGLGGGIVPFFLLGAAALFGSVDIRSLDIRDEKQDDFVPGDFGFDPLCISKGMTAEEKFKMAEREINNGRLAMVAVIIYVIEEFMTKAPLLHRLAQLPVALASRRAVISFTPTYDPTGGRARARPVHRAPRGGKGRSRERATRS